MSLFHKTPGGLIVGDQELEIAKRRANMVYDGSTIGQENKMADVTTEYEKTQALIDKANAAPIPNVIVPDNKVILRAAPLNSKIGTSGLISTDYDNINPNIVQDIVKTEGLYNFVQEVLVVGEMAKENYPWLKAGMKVRIDEANFINGRYQRGGYENELYYQMPTYYIDGHTYLVIESHCLLYIVKEEE